MLFSELYKIMVNKVTFVGFRGGDRHNPPSLDPPPDCTPKHVGGPFSNTSGGHLHHKHDLSLKKQKRDGSIPSLFGLN